MKQESNKFNAASFVRAVSHNWLGRFCAIGITFLVTPAIIRGVGDEAYGMWTMVISLGVYYGLSNLGLRAAGVKYIAEYDSHDDQESVNSVLMTMLAAYVPLSVLVLLLAVVLAFVFPAIVESSLPDNTVRTVILITALSASIGIVGQTFSAVLVARRKFGQINALSVTAQMVQGAGIILAVNTGHGLILMATIVLAVMTSQQVATYWLAMRAAGHPRLRPQHFRRSTLRLLLNFGVLNVAVAAARKFMNYGGGLIVGVMVGPVMVAYYGVAASLVRKLEDLGKGVNSVLMPVVSELDARGEREELAGAFLLASRTVLAIAIGVATVFVLLGQSLLSMWIDPGYGVMSYPVLILLAVGMALRLPRNAAANVLKGTARVRPLAKIGVVEACVALALGCVLVWNYGMLGMAWAAVATDLLFSLIVVALTCTTIGVSLVAYLRGVVLPAGAAAVPGVALGLFLHGWAPPSRLLDVVVQGGMICGVTGVTMLFVCFDRAIRSSFTSRRALRRS